MKRRTFLKTGFQATFTALTALASTGCRLPSPKRSRKPNAADSDLIREGFRVATEKYLYPSLLDRIYPGHFIVAPDGGFGTENTWPGLDSWQMAGAYLLLGRERVVLDYFDFVEASQREDGRIPFAIFPGEQSPGSLDSWLRGLRFPEDVYTYTPKQRVGRRAGITYKPRKWIGLFKHWQVKVNPLSDLGALSYVLTASEVFRHTQDQVWLREKLPSVEKVRMA